MIIDPSYTKYFDNIIVIADGMVINNVCEFNSNDKSITYICKDSNNQCIIDGDDVKMVKIYPKTAYCRAEDKFTLAYWE